MNVVTLVGNACEVPELKFSHEEPIARATFRLAVEQPRHPSEGRPLVNFFSVVCWRQLAENTAASVGKGDRIVVTGWVKGNERWFDIEGQVHYFTEIHATSVALSLEFATAQALRVTRTPPLQEVV